VTYVHPLSATTNCSHSIFVGTGFARYRHAIELIIVINCKFLPPPPPTHNTQKVGKVNFQLQACWKQHVENKVREGEIHTMSCPAFQCESLIPRDVVFSLVNKEAREKYDAFDIKAFLEGNAQMRRCPFPDCTRAVYVPVFFDDGRKRFCPKLPAQFIS
jgi:hypothetical protein